MKRGVLFWPVQAARLGCLAGLLARSGLGGEALTSGASGSAAPTTNPSAPSFAALAAAPGSRGPSYATAPSTAPQPVSKRAR